MCSLYSGIAKGQAPANALRAAKLTVMREGGRYGKPFYWAPFLTYTRERS
jgi:CHAT domain-containing protein